MRIAPAPGSQGPSGLMGALSAWLRSWTALLQAPPGHQRLPAAAAAVNADFSSRSERGTHSRRHRHPHPGLHPNNRVRVLVVDDNPVNLLLMSAQLQARGLVPMLAADGAEAVALACELRFDLILMDLQMPILDGLEATAAIRRFEADRSGPAVPVVAFSSCATPPRLLALKGLDGSLPKPCEEQELEACLVHWCPGYLATAPEDYCPVDRPSARSHEGGPWLTARRNNDAAGAWLRRA